MKKLKFFSALFLFISCLPLFSQDYLIRIDFDEYKLFLVNNTGTVIAAYPVVIPKFISKHPFFYGTVISAEKNPNQIIIRFDALEHNPSIRIYGTDSEILINREITSKYIVMHNRDILDLIETIEGKQVRVLFEK